MDAGLKNPDPKLQEQIGNMTQRNSFRSWQIAHKGATAPLTTITLIAAVDEKGAIGRDGKIPWHLKADLQRFKKLTEGHTVIMGRRTFESIGRPLPRRKNIVLTKQGNLKKPGVMVAESWGEVIYRLVNEEQGEVFVIGGRAVYKEAFALADKILLTRVHAVIPDADCFFPLDLIQDSWKEVLAERSETYPADAENDFPFHTETFIYT